MRIALFVTEDWYVCSHRLPVIREAVRRGHEVAVVTHVDRHDAPIREAGATVVPVGLDRSGANPVDEARVLRQLHAALRGVRPDVLHNVALKPVIYGSVVGRAAGVPVVVNALAGLGAVFLGHGGALRQGLRAALGRALRSRRATVLVQNADDRAIVEGIGVAPSRIALIPGSGVDLDRFTPRPPPPEPPVRVLYVGRLLYDKGVGDLHDAARDLHRLGLDVEVVAAGDRDPHNPACIDEATIAAWRAEGAMTFLGQRDDIAELLGGAHVAVLPSYREGLPKALLEAAAAGRPMVATDVPGCRDVVRPGETGVLVPPRRPDLLAAAIAELVKDPAERARLGAAARAMAESEYGDRRAATATVDLYERLAGR